MMTEIEKQISAIAAQLARIAAELGRTEKAVQHQLEPFNVKPQADSLRLKL